MGLWCLSWLVGREGRGRCSGLRSGWKAVWLHLLGKHGSRLLHPPPGPGDVVPLPALGLDTEPTALEG